MEFKIRLTARPGNFPLPNAGCAEWQADRDQWRCSIALPPIPKEHIVVPSFASLDGQLPYQFTMQATGETVLNPVPTPASFAARNQSKDVSAHIDCWHTSQNLDCPTVHIVVCADRRPTDYLLCVSVRPLHLPHPPAPARDVVAPMPAAVSQMQADARIKQRICSPVALAMALGLTTEADWKAIVAACYDPSSCAYGAWPLAIRQANSRGYTGSVECAADWEDALLVLAHGMPVVCSIRFGQGELRGAPLAATGGHLVCLYGVRQGKALVMDPAAPEPSSVARRYDLDEFTRAWLTRRGAAYYLCNRT